MKTIRQIAKFDIVNFTNFISNCSKGELLKLSDVLNDEIGKMILNPDLCEKLAAVEEEINRRERNNIH